ncbi:amidase [Trinickia fusca]|uniref:Amidase n=1 Tax=Trinickia fusca TaxID=2419777 RepID=A0A494XRH2_9BURK|nr:amidase family protein [Trinickia fusca]RKP52251.1 amidase [Trinickia fusca]
MAPQSRPEGFPFLDMDATAQASLVKNGEARAIDLIDAAIERIERLQPRLNALASFDFDLARKQALAAPVTGATSVFAGVPTLVKDLLAYPGHPTSSGSRLFQGQRPPAVSPYAQALEQSGLVVLGKSATSEFGLLGTTEPLLNGATHNPWRLDLSPGGSSGGAVAAVASGMVPVAHASDGGGSIRGPASFTGLFGFKPSRGRTVATDMPPDMPTASLISDHCVSRSVRDSAAWLKAVETPGHASPLPAVQALQEHRVPRLRIGVYRRDAFGELPTPQALEALDACAKLCADLGHEVVDAQGPQFDAPAASQAFFDLTGATLAGLFDYVSSLMGPAFDTALIEPYTLEIVRRARSLAPARMHEAIAALTTAGNAVHAALAPVDLLLSPTVPFTAFPLGQFGPTEDPATLMSHTNRLAGYTVPASLAGCPAMSVPLYWSADGLPLGCHFVGRLDHDARLLRLAFELEEAAPWAPQLLRLQEKLLWPSV